MGNDSIYILQLLLLEYEEKHFQTWPSPNSDEIVIHLRLGNVMDV